MGDQDWRAAKRAATRARLTEATLALIAERGYDAVAISDIAAAAEVSVPTFYAYFRTKEHVLFPDQDPAWVMGLLRAQPTDLPLTERVRRGLQDMITALPHEAEAELLRRWQLALTVPAVRSRSADRETASIAALVDALGLDLSTSDDAARVVVISACMTASTTSFLRWAATGGERPLGELVDEAFHALRSI